jgi:putative restriction endonuclease
MNKLSRKSLLENFAGMKIFQRGEQRAIHKPLLVLFALGRMAKGEDRLMDFAAIDRDFKGLLQEFGPSSAPSTRHYPFWHLATDAGGSLWELVGPEHLLGRPRGVTPNVSELRSNHVQGGFTSQVYQTLKSDAVLRQDLARLILQTHFPESLHHDILSATGLDFDEPSLAESALAQPARRRDPGFRERVLRAYEYRCCVCAFDLRIGTVAAGLEAAHIQWFQAQGPDTESNGLALCSLHHKLFDLGAFTVTPSSFKLVFSEHISMGDTTRRTLLIHHGAGITLPQSERYYPDAARLEWHARWVFKKPARDVQGEPTSLNNSSADRSPQH